MVRKKANDKYRYSLKGRYATLKRNAVRNGFEFNISYYDYALLTANGCYYCGSELPKAGHGVDRRDSSKGYIEGNILPCCSICNVAKGTLTEQKFIAHIRNIYRHLKIK